MNTINKNYSLEENLRDTKHNSKAHEVFLKLIAKKTKANPFGAVKSHTYQLNEIE